MIAKLAGVVEQIEPDAAVLDVGGVGYLTFCSTRTIGRLPAPGSPARLLIETHVREDHIHLYGFIDAAERDWFRLLTTVQGVGARLALALLSAVPPEKLGLAILAQDKPALAQADGVGPRLAARIVNELRDKIGNLVAPVSAPLSLPANGQGATADAIAALVKLGYSQMIAADAIARASQAIGPNSDALPLDALIRESLRQLAR